VFDAGGRRWEARAAPFAHPAVAVAVFVRPLPAETNQREALLRAAHDLKAPIHTIDGFAKLLLRETAGPLNERQRQFLEVAASEAARLRAHLERVLEIARTGEAAEGRPAAPGGELAERGPTDVVTVLDEALTRFAGAAEARGVTLAWRADVERPPAGTLLVAAPEGEVTTILENLLANAIAATPAGGGVWVSAEVVDAGMIACRVEDTGPGIPPNALERVFEPYFRLPRRGAPGGTGLGLAISRGLAEARGGRLVAANRAEGGAVFTLTLPAAAEPAPKSPVLRLAPVVSHTSLAAARTALETHLAGTWRIIRWEGGVLAVEVDVPPAEARRAAEAIAQTSGFACWVG
jgi:signal transduction histidine kinase